MPSIIAFWGVICYLPPFRGTRNGFGVSFLMKMFREYVVEYFSSSRFGSCNLFICLLWDLLQPESFRESWEIKSLSNIIPARFRSKQNANHRQPFTTPTAGFLGGKQKKKKEPVKRSNPTHSPKKQNQTTKSCWTPQVQVSGQHRSSTTRLACRQRTFRHSQTC